jgi:hypothetical protein
MWSETRLKRTQDAATKRNSKREKMNCLKSSFWNAERQNGNAERQNAFWGH